MVKQPSIRTAPADLQAIALGQSADRRTGDQKQISVLCSIMKWYFPWTRQIVKTATICQYGRYIELNTELLQIAELVVES